MIDTIDCQQLKFDLPVIICNSSQLSHLKIGKGSRLLRARLQHDAIFFYMIEKLAILAYQKSEILCPSNEASNSEKLLRSHLQDYWMEPPYVSQVPDAGVSLVLID